MTIKRLIGFALLSTAALALNACGGVKASDFATTAPVVTAKPAKAAYTVKLDTCKSEYGVTTATLTITNTTDKLASFVVIAEAVDAKGNRIAELNGAANSIQPGKSARVQAIGMGPVPTNPVCKVASVTHLPSF